MRFSVFVLKLVHNRGENMENSVIYPKIKFQPTGLRTIVQVLDQIDAFKRGIGNERLNLRPSYQRGEAWEYDFKEKLVYSLITNYPIGNFIFRRVEPTISNATLEVVDGQQRLLTIYELVRGNMELSPSMSRQIITENMEYFEYDQINSTNNLSVREFKKYLKNDKANIKLSFKSLPSLIQTQILNYNLSVIEVTCSDEAITQYFRFIQNQERLRAGEIINSIPDTPLRKYLDSIEDKETFLSKIKWNESRKEFDKIFYSIIGVLEGKLNFGTTDNSIIEYVSKVESINESTDAAVNQMVQSINAVSKSEAKNNYKFSKRLIKFFFLASGYGTINFINNTEEMFDKLCLIESKLPSFNSGSQEAIKEAFPNTSDDIILKYRELFLLGRGSHSPKETKRVISIIGELL